MLNAQWSMSMGNANGQCQWAMPLGIGIGHWALVIEQEAS
jgi:hypothetical protein